MSGIVSDFKKNLQGSDIDSVRELAIDAKKQGLNLSELALHFRLYNYFIKSGEAEEDIESFIANVSINGASPKKVIEYVNQLYEIFQYFGTGNVYSISKSNKLIVLLL